MAEVECDDIGTDTAAAAGVRWSIDTTGNPNCDRILSTWLRLTAAAGPRPTGSCIRVDKGTTAVAPIVAGFDTTADDGAVTGGDAAVKEGAPAVTG